MVQYRQEKSFSLLIDFGSSEMRSAKSWLGSKSVLKGTFQILHDKTERWEDYTSVTGCNKYHLLFFVTRFLSYFLMKFLKVTLETSFSKNLYHMDMVNMNMSGLINFYLP